MIYALGEHPDANDAKEVLAIVAGQWLEAGGEPTDLIEAMAQFISDVQRVMKANSH